MKLPFTALAILASGVLLLSSSCAGVKCKMTADKIDQPVSFTPCVYDQAGNVFTMTSESRLKHFIIKKRCWAMLWRNVNLTQNHWDLSDELQKELASVNGDAIVNLTIQTEGDMLWCLASLLPIIPDYHTIIVEGDVIRLPAKAPAP